MRLGITALVAVSACLGAEVPTAFEIAAGTAIFTASTNFADVKGKSNSLAGHMEVLREPSGLSVRNVDASLPVGTLATGIKLRDEHMRKGIFTTDDGRRPDLRFTAARVSCPAGAAEREFTCAVEGSLAIGGVPRPFHIVLTVKEEAAPPRLLRAAGDGVVKLSDYGIERPSRFGIRVRDDVKLHLEFAAKPR